MEVKSVAVFLSSLGGLILTLDGDGVSTCVACSHVDLFLSSLGGLILTLDGDGVSTCVICPHGDLCSFTSFDVNYLIVACLCGVDKLSDIVLLGKH